MASFIDKDGTKVRDGQRLARRSELLAEAERIITNDRNKSYGEPDEDFQRIAAIASALGFRITEGDAIRPLSGSDVATFMICLKLSRLAWMPTHRDSWMDIAGYAGCGYETAALEEERRSVVINADETKRETMLAPGVYLTPDLKELAQKAITGEPKDLEEAGLILVDSGWSVCHERCASGHTFDDHCEYRVRRRRHG